MNRQRRLEAIARRRAYIDSQLQLLSNANNHEVRVPNIIRNRAGRSQQQRRLNTRNSFIPFVQHQTSSELTSVQNNVHFLVKNDTINYNYSTEVFTKPNDNVCQGLNESEGTVPVPVEISDRIAQLIASNNGDILKSFQTIKLKDGTVMVVLEDDSNNINTETEEVEMVQERHAHSNESMVTTCESNPVAKPASEFTSVEPVIHHQIQTQEKSSSLEGGESYVIMQSEYGDVVVPSSIYSQIKEQTSSEREIVNYVASESGAIEDLMTRTPGSSVRKVSFPIPTHSSKRVKSVVSKRRLSSSQSSIPISCGSRLIANARLATHSCSPGRAVSVTEVHKKSKCERLTVPRNGIKGLKPKPSYESNSEEKPRPFRFEVPELELEDTFDDMRDNFLKVPVPIRIDSLRSETIPNSNNGGNVPSRNKVVTHRNSNSSFSCDKCSETFARVSDLLQHVKQNHVQTQEAISEKSNVITPIPTPKDVSSTFTLVEHESIIENEADNLQIASHDHNVHTVVHEIQENADSQNQFLLPHNIRVFGHAEDGTTIFQIIDASDNESKATKIRKTDPSILNNSFEEVNSSANEQVYTIVNNTDINNETEELSLVYSGNEEVLTEATHADDSEARGRRTLIKATAKADMSSEDSYLWVSSSDTLSAECVDTDSLKNNQVDYNGDTMSLQSARIRSRNDRVKAMDDDSKKEEELGVNFRNIFQQVVKQGVSFY